MVRRNYCGVRDAEALFENLRPAHRALVAMMQQVRPFSPDYLILLAAADALHTARGHFTGDRTYYSAGMPG
jgi:hypothetical protein